MTTWRRAGGIAVAGGLVAALALTGCGRDGDEADSAGEEASAQISEGPAKGEITVWAMGTEGEKLSTLAADFQKDNPDATIKVTPVPWDGAHDKIATAIAGGQTPDVTMLGTTWMGEFAKTGALDPTPDSAVDKSQFFPGAWETGVVDGTSYGVPWYVETRVLFYRKDFADRAGLQAPTDWQSLTEFANGLKQSGAEYGLMLQPGQMGAWQTMMPFAWQQGAELEKDGEYTLDTEPMREALAYYKSFFDAGLSPTGILRPGQLETDFVAGRIGAFFSGPWHVGLIKDVGGAGIEGKWAVSTMPKEQSATSFVGGSNLAVFKESANRDSAWKFVQWLSKPDVQQKWYGIVADLPAVKSAWDSGALATDPILATFGKQLEDAKSLPSTPTWEQVAAGIDSEIEKVVKGGTDPADAANSMQSQADSIGTG